MKYIDRLVEIINIHRNHKDLTYEQVKSYIIKAFEDLASANEVSAKVLEYRIDDRLSYTEIKDLLELDSYDLTNKFALILDFIILSITSKIIRECKV